MDFTVVDGISLDERDAARWRTLLAARTNTPSPFLTPTFTRVVAHHRSDTRVVVLQDGGQVVGFLPYHRTGERVGLPVGAHLNDVQAIVGPPRASLDVRALVRAMGVRDWRFDHLLVDEHAFAPYFRHSFTSPTIDVSEGADAYESRLRRRSRNVLQQDRRMRRRVTAELGPLSFEWRSTSHALLDWLLEWKSAQYRRTGVGDALEPPWTRAALHHFLDVSDGESDGLLSVLRAGDRVLAAHFGLVGARVLHYWFPVYDPALARYSPGILLLFDLACAAPEHGLTLVDLGMGEHPYKLRLATGSYEVAQGQVPARGDAYRAALLARHPGWVRRRVAESGRRLAGRVATPHAG